ncbi:hypothetical protein EDC01DRAFT_676859, partial [Geopyxis carbonaria]
MQILRIWVFYNGVLDRLFMSHIIALQYIMSLCSYSHSVSGFCLVLFFGWGVVTCGEFKNCHDIISCHLIRLDLSRSSFACLVPHVCEYTAMHVHSRPTFPFLVSDFYLPFKPRTPRPPAACHNTKPPA